MTGLLQLPCPPLPTVLEAESPADGRGVPGWPGQGAVGVPDPVGPHLEEPLGLPDGRLEQILLDLLPGGESDTLTVCLILPTWTVVMTVTQFTDLYTLS